MSQNIFVVVRRPGGIWPAAHHGHFLLLTADPRQAQDQSGNSHSQPFNRSLQVFSPFDTWNQPSGFWGFLVFL
jgi:hypothetical protein